ARQNASGRLQNVGDEALRTGLPRALSLGNYRYFAFFHPGLCGKCEWRMRMIIRILARTGFNCIFSYGVAMNTLTTPPLSEVLKRLFAESDVSEGLMRQEMSHLTPQERADAHRQSSTDYQTFYMTR